VKGGGARVVGRQNKTPCNSEFAGRARAQEHESNDDGSRRSDEECRGRFPASGKLEMPKAKSQIICA
jgi:hypothetical protein